jgi:mono/diheme cytochrome c family protein
MKGATEVPRDRQCLALIGATLCVGFLLAGGPAASAGTDPAWSEKMIREHIDFSKLEGVLSADQLKALVAAGLHLFTARFTTEDGLGRPMATQAIIPTPRKRPVDFTFMRTAGLDSNACSSCHNVPGPGGAGDFTANVFVSEGFESADFDSLDPQFSNERGTNHMFGSGLLELLAREMTADLRAERDQAVAEARKSGKPVTVALSTKGVGFGKLTVDPGGVIDISEIDGVDPDLIIRPFSQKGVFTSLRQFTINAMNAHHGMEATERFGARWTGTADFDQDGHPDELSPGDISALVAFQATLPSPTEKVPDDPDWRAAAARGSKVFTDLGCAQCHRPALPLNGLAFADPAPYDMAGTLRTGEVEKPAVYDLALLDWVQKLPRNDQGQILVPLFGDLKRHKIADGEVNQLANELLAQRFVERDVFMTAELWGVASTAPYGHRGDISTLDEMIRAHGGEGRAARDAYIAADDADRSAIVAYLKTLVIEP